MADYQATDADRLEAERQEERYYEYLQDGVFDSRGIWHGPPPEDEEVDEDVYGVPSFLQEPPC